MDEQNNNSPKREGKKQEEQRIQRSSYRRRLYEERTKRTSSVWLNLMISIFILGTIIGIWQPWKSPEERLLSEAERFKEELSNEIGNAAMEVEEAKKKAKEEPPWPGREMFDAWLAGSSVRIVVYTPKFSDAKKLIEPLKQAVLEAGKWFDRNNITSPLYKLENSKPGTFVKLPEPFFYALSLYLRYAKQLYGQCDPTTGVLIDLYHFGDGEKNDTYPDKEDRKKAMKLVSYKYLRLNPADKSAALTKAGVKLDWITLGRAAMLMVAKRVASHMNIQNFAVFAGMDALTNGKRLVKQDESKPWDFDVPYPQLPFFKKLGVLEYPPMKTVGAAVASEKGRLVKKYWIHPFIHPISGMPGRKSLQAWVISDDPAQAVVAARCAFLAGADTAKGWLKRMGLDAMIAPAEGNVVFVGNFKKYFTLKERSIFEEDKEKESNSTDKEPEAKDSKSANGNKPSTPAPAGRKAK